MQSFPWRQCLRLQSFRTRSLETSVILVEQCSKPPRKGENNGGTPASLSFYCLNKITERHVVCRLHPCVIIGTKDWEFEVVIIWEEGHSPTTASSLSPVCCLRHGLLLVPAGVEDNSCHRQHNSWRTTQCTPAEQGCGHADQEKKMRTPNETTTRKTRKTRRRRRRKS